MERISDHLYVETGYLGSNVGCIITERGLVTIDCPLLPHEIEDWREKLAQISHKEVAYAICTDHHLDHSMTAGLFCRRVIAQNRAYKGMRWMQDNREQVFKQFFPDEYERSREFFSNINIALPQIVFSSQMTLNMGSQTIELTYVGGHSPSTIMIHIPEERVVFLGDNLDNGLYPYTGEAMYGLWIELLNNVEQMNVETIVPGHGDICGKETIRKLRSYFEEMWVQVSRLRRSGLTKEEVIDRVKLKGLPSWLPVSGMDLKTQVAVDVGRMYDQLEKKLL